TRSIRLIFSEKEAGIVDDLRPYLFWSSDSCVHVRFLEEKKCFSIGSDRACDVSLPAPHLAANHATIVRNICRGSIQFSIKPIFSRHVGVILRAHVFVNGIQVSKKGTRTLTSGDILTVSKDPQAVKFRFNSGDGARARTAASSSPKSSSARNISQFSQTQDTPSPDANAATKATTQKQQVFFFKQ
ncbi:unnamed protein product, partial [Haemonchus placei]|uniref:FHA domain-containing protein n=1 Tax=Haemonchus placei TaxID=6290 RepID=A0A158QN20_HAEPC